MVSMVQDRIYPKLLIHINSFIKKDINTLYIRSERLILIKIKIKININGTNLLSGSH